MVSIKDIFECITSERVLCKVNNHPKAVVPFKVTFDCSFYLRVPFAHFSPLARLDGIWVV